MKNIFDWLIGRLTKERISERKDRSVEDFQTKVYRAKRIKTK